MPTITLCPPAAAHLVQPLDRHQFEQHHAHPVHHAEWNGEGDPENPTGLSFNDCDRMSTQRHAGHQRAVPEWTRKNENLQRVILMLWLKRSLFNSGGRAYFLANHADMSPLQQLKVLQTHLLQTVELHLLPHLDELCWDFATNPDPLQRKKLALEIRQLDAEIISIQKGPARLARLLHLAWGCGWDSVAIGSELKMTSVNVRQILHRALLCWAEISGEAYRPRNWGGRPVRPLSERPNQTQA